MDPTSFYLQLLLFPDVFLLLILSKEAPSKHFCLGCSFRRVIPLHLISFFFLSTHPSPKYHLSHEVFSEESFSFKNTQPLFLH